MSEERAFGLGSAVALPTPRLVLLLGIGLVPAFAGLFDDLGLYAAVGWDLLLAVAFLVDRASLPRPGDIGVTRRVQGRLDHGVVAEVGLQISAHRSGTAMVIDEPPRFFLGREVIERPIATRLIGGGTAEVAYSVKPRRRGRHLFGPVNVWAEGQLGLARRRLVVHPAGTGEVRVFPDLGLVDHGSLDPDLLLAELGLKKARRRAEGTELESLRDAVPDDELRIIDWRATARRGKPIAKNFELERNHEILICLDAGRLMGALHQTAEDAEVHRTKLDLAIQVAIRLASVAERSGDRVGLMAFHDQVLAWVRPERGRAQLGRLLEAVHDVEPSSADASYGFALTEIRRRQKKRALLVFLTDFVDFEASSEVLEAVSVLCRRHAVLFVALQDPLIRSIARAPVVTLDGAYRSLAALGLSESRARLIETLSSHGVRALDLLPEEVTAGAIRAYLQMRSEGRL